MTQVIFKEFVPKIDGSPAYMYECWVGKPNTDPTDQSGENLLAVYDGEGGVRTSNPYFVGRNGRPVNSNGAPINPVVNETEYSYVITAPRNGAILDRCPLMVGSIAGSSAGGGSADFVIDNFAQALVTDLSEYSLVYVRSYYAGWNLGDPSGRRNPAGFYIWRNGDKPGGTPSTGTPGRFLDAAGNEWIPAKSQKLYAEMFGAIAEVGFEGNTKAFQDLFNAGNDLGRPVYAEDKGDYEFKLQVNEAENYSNLEFYAIKLSGYVEFYMGEETQLINENQNSQQYILFAENCTTLKIDGGVIDGKAVDAGIAGIKTGSLFIAGCGDVELNTEIKRSAPMYCCQSSSNNTKRIESNVLVFTEAVDYAVSGSGGGVENFVCDTIIFDNCQKGIDSQKDDVDSFGLDPADPIWGIGEVYGSVTQNLFRCKEGGVSINKVFADCDNRFNIDLDVADFKYIKYNEANGEVAGKSFNFLGSNGGKILEVVSDKKPLANGVDIIPYTDGSMVVYEPKDGITRVRATIFGGGGGGYAGGSNNAGDGSPSTLNHGGVSLSGNGGARGQFILGGGATGGDFNYKGGDAVGATGGRANAPFIFNDADAPAGGSVPAFGGNGDVSGDGGGAGGCALKLFDIDFTLDVEVTIGNGGNRDTSGGNDGFDGGKGYCVIEY